MQTVNNRGHFCVHPLRLKEKKKKTGETELWDVQELFYLCSNSVNLKLF